MTLPRGTSVAGRKPLFGSRRFGARVLDRAQHRELVGIFDRPGVSPDAVVSPRQKDFFGLVARQGSLGSGPAGIKVADSVRAQLELWATCASP